MLGLRTTPQDKAGLSAAKALYSSPLCLSGEFLHSEDLPPGEFLDRIQSGLCGLTLPPPHHVTPSSAQVPAALASAEYLSVYEEASIRPLSPLYRGPYRVLSRQDKFFLGNWSRTAAVSVDRLC